MFQALREQLRCKEIWVVGADRWRNPDEDLPDRLRGSAGPSTTPKLRKPLDPGAFTGQLRAEMEPRPWPRSTTRLPRPGLGGHRRTAQGRARSGSPRWTPRPSRATCGGSRQAIQDRWGTVPLIDMLKETALRTGCLDAFTAVGTRGDIAAADGARGAADAGRLRLRHQHRDPGGRRRRARPQRGRDPLRPAPLPDPGGRAGRPPGAIANATFAARQAVAVGRGLDRGGVGLHPLPAWDQNIFTEWHSRYGGRGVLIYWHVEKAGSMAVHSQLLECSASEVHAMVEGAIRHGTDMDVEGNYVDTHGQSEIGFGITRLLGFDLLPRIKQINKVQALPARPPATWTPTRGWRRR